MKSMQNKPQYISKYDSPLGGMTLASDGECLIGLWFDDQNHFGTTLNGDLKEGDLRRTLLEYAGAPQITADAGDKQPTSLELTVTRSLQEKGYEIRQNIMVGSLNIPVAAQSGNKRVIIACDGEHWVDSIKEAASLRYNQAVLERLGWTFLRVQGSQWYLHPEESLQKLEKQLQDCGIMPGTPGRGEGAAADRQELAIYIRQRAEQLVGKWHQGAAET